MTVMHMRAKKLLPSASLLMFSLAMAPGCGEVGDDTSAPAGGAVNGPSGGAEGTGAAPGSGGAGGPGSGGVTSGGSNGPGAGGSPGVGGAGAGAAVGTGGAGNPTTGGAPSIGGGDPGVGGGSSGGSGNDGDVQASQGCGKAPPTAGQASISVGGQMRDYILALPDNYDNNKKYRLVFTWHPWGGSAQQVAQQMSYYGLRTASAGEAILVSPDGTDFGGNGKGWGNDGGKDIQFLEAMLERFDSELCFDHNRIFSTGFSFGGMMSNAVACSGLARAIAPMAGNSSVSGCANGTKPVAYMGFHGVDDTVVTLDGGQKARDVFVSRNGCGMPKASDSNWCQLAGNQYQPCECKTYDGCDDGYPVTWCEYKGGHMVAPNSGQTIWDFFAQF